MACGGVLAVLLGLRDSEDRVTWNPATSRFVIGSNTVSMITIRDTLARLQTYTGVQMAKAAERFFAGLTSFEVWRTQMTEMIASSHILAAALAVGSVHAAIANPKTSENIARQQRFAVGMGDDIAMAKKGMTLQRVKARARSYAAAVGVTFATIEQDLRATLGIDQFAYRNLTATESCDGCQAWAGQWIPIDDMPEIGSLDCGQYCKCIIEYS